MPHRIRLLSIVAITLALAGPGAPAARAASAPATRPGGPGRPVLPNGSRVGDAPVVPGSKSMTLLYGDDHCFGLVPPDGWVVDDQSGMGSKIRVVLYPKGQKWENAQTVMYVNPIHQDPKARRTFAQMIDRDVESFRKQSPRGMVSSGAPIRTLRGKQAQVRYFAPTGGKPVTAVAYVEEPDLVMLLVLDSRSDAGLRTALPAFNEMVGSYQFVAGNIDTPTAPAAPGARPGNTPGAAPAGGRR